MQSFCSKLFLLAFALNIIFTAPTVFASTFVPGSIVGDTTWNLSGSPYVIGGSLVVPQGATLTIEPGVVVKLDMLATMSVSGTLIADHAIFTSYADDAIGGDSNENGSANGPAGREWDVILIEEGSVATFTGSAIHYGGRSCQNYCGAITNRGGTLTVDQLTASAISHRLIYQVSGTTTVTNSTLSGGDCGVWATAGSFTIGHNDFEIPYCAGSFYGTVQFHNIGGNTGIGGYLFTSVASVPLSGSSTWIADGIPYLPQPGFMIPSDASLTIAPGALVKLSDTGITIYGTLTASDVTFTSLRDDSVGGDTNADGGATTPAPSDWSGMLNYGTLTLGHDTIHYGGRQFNTIAQIAGTSTIINSDIAYANTGVQYQGGGLIVTHNNLHDLGYGVYNQSALTTIDATHNYWGDTTGPLDIYANPNGKGSGVSGFVSYIPFDTSDQTEAEVGCTVDCYSNMMFLPGIESSRLYRPDYAGGEDKLWEPNINSDIEDLYLNNNGDAIRDDVYTKRGDVIDELPSGENIYKSFIDKMNTLASDHKMNNWEAIPYDWRLSLHDIVTHGNLIGDKIYYSGTLSGTTSPYIIQQLRYLASKSKTGKVTIIAHSNGGLLAKEVLRTLGDQETTALIDRLILVASPQVGTPAAFAASMHGYDQDHLFGLITSKPTARTFASTSPMLYNLLPSANYFTYVDDPIASFDSTLPEWSSRFGQTIHSQVALSNFLSDSFGKVNSKSADTDSPILMNNTQLNQANDLHQQIDNWQAPQGVKVIEIAGWGIPTTVKGITYGKVTKSYCQGGVCTLPITKIEPDIQFTIDGDGTVVTPSALWATSSLVSKYWVDLDDNNIIFIRNANHGSILEVNGLLDFLGDAIKDTISSTDSYSSLREHSPIFTRNRLRYSLHSPLSLDLYDMQGRHTGYSSTTNKLEEQIPETYFKQIGTVKYLFTNASTSVKIVMRGYATSSFKLEVQQLIGDKITASTTFVDIPTTPNTTAFLNTVGDISTLSSLSIDQNNDGVSEYTLTPKINGITTIPNDTTPPEMRLVFSTSTQKLIGIGLDISSTTAYVSTTSASTVDVYGNNVQVGFMGYKEKKGRVSYAVSKLGYNNNLFSIATTTVKYKWTIDKQGKYSMFVAYLQNATTTTEIHYRPKKNQTFVMQYPTDMDDNDSDENYDTRPTQLKLQGLVIPWIETQDGNIVIKY